MGCRYNISLRREVQVLVCGLVVRAEYRTFEYAHFSITPLGIRERTQTMLTGGRTLFESRGRRDRPGCHHFGKAAEHDVAEGMTATYYDVDAADWGNHCDPCMHKLPRRIQCQSGHITLTAKRGAEREALYEIALDRGQGPPTSWRSRHQRLHYACTA